jgi:hypothetical protein
LAKNDAKMQRELGTHSRKFFYLPRMNYLLLLFLKMQNIKAPRAGSRVDFWLPDLVCSTACLPTNVVDPDNFDRIRPLENPDQDPI